MRIGELSRRTGVPVPTIKYYVRAGLLPSGELTSPNQASYGEAHERRLRLVRALLEVGGLKVAAVAELLAVVDDQNRTPHKVLGAAAARLGGPGDDDEDEEAVAARAEVEALAARRGWKLDESNAATADLVQALATMFRLGHGEFARVLDDYAEAAERVARADLDHVGRSGDLEGIVESMVIGTVLGEVVLAAMRRVAHVNASADKFGDGSGPAGA